MNRIGFGLPTGIDIEGERGGIMPSPEWKKTAFSGREQQVWFPGETVIIGIGQGYWTATILQLAKATALLATRGRHFRPRLVRALVDPTTGAVEQRQPEALPPVELKNRDNWETIVNAMVAVTSGSRGTAVRASRGALYSIAGKTGTAQVFSVGQTEKYDEKTIAERLRDHALFVAFAPADSAALAIAVLVENGGHGSSAAAPIARAVFDAYLLRQEPSDDVRGTRRIAHAPHGHCDRAAAARSASRRHAAVGAGRGQRVRHVRALQRGRRQPVAVVEPARAARHRLCGDDRARAGA